MKFINNRKEINKIIELNKTAHKNDYLYSYHMQHLNVTMRYALILNEKIGTKNNRHKLKYISLAHDLFKERKYNNEEGSNKPEPFCQDVNRYVRLNLDVLEEYELDDYFNTDVQLHALSAGIFLHKELGVRDKEILYPVMFHSCPILPIYEKLTDNEKLLVDIIMLADKLSSNHLKINVLSREVRIDLDQTVFGSNGKQFNYELGLYIARLISQGKNPDKESIRTTEYYLTRLRKNNPLIPLNTDIKSLGGSRIWEKRKSQVLKTI